MKNIISLVLGAISVIFWLAGNARAESVTYSFSGVLTDIRQSGAGLSYGDLFSATYIHDDSPQAGRAIESNRIGFSGGRLTIDAGSQSFIGPAASELQVLNDWSSSVGGYLNDDGFFVSGFVHAADGGSFSLLQFDMWDFSGTTLSDLTVPSQLQIQQLALHGRIWIRKFEQGVETGLASGNFSVLVAVSPVPEPASWLLLLPALAGLAYKIRAIRPSAGNFL